jgi:hypothetical protein
VLVTAEGGINYGQWRPLALYDLTNKNVKAHYSPKFVTDFKSLKPNQTGLRLLVLETSIAVDDITVRMLFCAFFMLEYRCIEQMNAFNEKFGNFTALQTDSLLNSNEPNQLPQKPNSVRIVNVFHDFMIMHQREQSQAKAKASLDKLAEKGTKLDEAMAVYRRKREQVRHRALFHNSSTLIAFMLRYFATTLVERYEKEKPNFPEQLMIHINVEAAGSTINLDETHCVGLSAMSKLVEASTEMLAKLEADVKPVTKESPEAEKAAFVASHQAIALHHHQLVKLKQAEARLKECNPATEVLFSIVESGKWQDKGTSIEAFFTVDVPYPLLCAQYAEMKADLVKQEQERNRADTKAAEEKAVASESQPLTAGAEELRALAAVLGPPQHVFQPYEVQARPAETLTLQHLVATSRNPPE